jgi:Iron-containing redox enzyme
VTASAELAGKVGLLLPALRQAQYALWTGPDLRGRYADYLVAMHGVIRASVPLMRAAQDRCAELAWHDPAAPALAGYLAEHIEEELGHDEWLRADLVALGADPDEPLRRVPPALVAAAVGAQYYWLAHVHPAVLLGYVWLLEAYPPAPAFVLDLQRRSGLPAAAFSTLRRHAALDVAHRAELAAVIDALPLDPTARAALGVNALQTTGQLTLLFRQLAARPRPETTAA